MGKGKKKGTKKDKNNSESKSSDESKENETSQQEVVVKESDQVRRWRTNIKNAFALFDKEGQDRIMREEVGTVMRYLGQFPCEQMLVEELIPAMQQGDDTGDAYVTFERFEPKMLDILKTNEFAPEGQDVIISAFKALDEDKKGYVDAEFVKQLLSEMGTPFKAKELESFLNVAKDISTGRIYYEDYATLYAQQVDANDIHWKSTKLPEEQLLESKFAF